MSSLEHPMPDNSPAVLTTEQLKQYQEDGFLLLEGWVPDDLRQPLIDRAYQLIEQADLTEHNRFSTTDRAQINNDFFLESAETIRCFFEEKAFDEAGELTQPRAQSINKIGHALHDLDDVYQAFARRPEFGALARDLGLQTPHLYQTMVIFKQPRIGENGRIFDMYKFRTMVHDPEDNRPELIKISEEGAKVHKLYDDPRVTHVGRFLRRTSLDELPQLCNILKGEMSLVGPRPELPWLVDKYEPWQRKRFEVPQGLTGWWQVNGRADKPMHLHTEDDLYYIKHYSLWLDLQILWRTIKAVIERRGAY